MNGNRIQFINYSAGFIKQKMIYLQPDPKKTMNRNIQGVESSSFLPQVPDDVEPLFPSTHFCAYLNKTNFNLVRVRAGRLWLYFLCERCEDNVNEKVELATV